MMSLSQAARAVSGTLAGTDLAFSSVSTDNRALIPGALFVALRGERFDGHSFVQAALSAGAAAAMVDARARGEAGGAWPGPLVVVDDTRAALGRLAAAWRLQHALPLIGIVGSNGKTTVKEMTAAILRAGLGADAVLATQGNLNNDIGLPLTLLRLRAAHRAGVVEIGMNHPGETAALAAIARPTIGVINNAQREHQEFMSSVAEVAREHAALVAALPAHGVAVVNADDEFAPLWRKAAAGAGASVRDFGVDRPAAVRARYDLREFSSEVLVSTPEGEARFTLPLAGVHNVRNALAAAASATAAGADLQAVSLGLSGFQGVKGRQQRMSSRAGAVLIDDSYNANPESGRAAIDVLRRFPPPTVLVLGDMGEVGEKGEEFHREIGTYARAAGLTSLLGLGRLSAHSVAAFGPKGEHATSIEELLGMVARHDKPGATLLVKGSRFMRMERVVAAIAAGGEGERKAH
jgi:UDP-N-acetylmuramoyl-tripeptide--D-alanyl-D-alanine ligase